MCSQRVRSFACGFVFVLGIAASGGAQNCAVQGCEHTSGWWGSIYPSGIAASGNRFFYAFRGLDDYWSDNYLNLYFVDLEKVSQNMSSLLMWDSTGISGEVLVASSSHLYLGAFGGNYLGILDVSDPTSVDFHEVYSWGAHDVDLSGRHAYVAAGLTGLVVLDVSDPGSPVEVGSIAFDSMGAETIDVSGSLAYVAGNIPDLQIINVSNPSSPVVLGTFDTTGLVTDVAVSPGFAYIADSGAGLRVVDVSNPSAPVEVAGSPYGAARLVAYSDGYLYATQGLGVRILDLAVPSNPVDVHYYDAPTLDYYGPGLAVSRGFLAFDYSTHYGDETRVEILDLRGCPVAWWSANGDADDVVGFNNGTEEGSGYTAGILDQAFHFNGTSAGVSIPSSAELSVGTGDFSLVFWVRTTAGAGSGFRAIQDKRWAVPDVGYHVFLNEGRPGLQLMDSQDTCNFVAPSSIADGNFHLLAITVDRDSGTGGKIYVDGEVELEFDPTVVQGSLANGQEFRLGRRSDAWGGDGYFDGTIDEVRFYDRALSEAEVDYNYATTFETEIFSDDFETGTTGDWSGSVL